MDGGELGEQLAGTPAGLRLAVLLNSIDVTAVSNGSIIDVPQASARQRAHTDGVYLGAIASTLERDPSAGPDSISCLAEPDRYAPDEVRTALVMPRRQGWNESEFAYLLCRGLPEVHAEMLAGRVDRDRALVFVQHLAGLPAALVAKVLDAVLAAAPGLTTGQLRARILKLIITVDPDHAQDAYERALAERAVVGYLNPDGTAVISASGLPPDEAAAATERIAALARAAKRAGHPGRVDQLRADIYLRLLDGRFHQLTHLEMIAALLTKATQTQTPPAEPRPTQSPTGDIPPAQVPPAQVPYADIPTANVPKPDRDRTDSAEPDSAEPTSAERAWAGPDDTEPDQDRPHNHQPAPAPRPAASEHKPLGSVTGIEVRTRLDSLAGINQLPGELPGWGRPLPTPPDGRSPATTTANGDGRSPTTTATYSPKASPTEDPPPAHPSTAPKAGSLSWLYRPLSWPA